MTLIRATPGRAALLASILALAACDNGVGPGDSTHLRIRIATTGVSLDPDGYTLYVRGGGSELSQPITADRVVELDRLPGQYTAVLADVSPNCAVAGGVERPLAASGQVAIDSAKFDVNCAHADGSLTVSTNLSDDVGPGPFTIQLQARWPTLPAPRSIDPVDSARFTDLADGNYVLELRGNDSTWFCPTQVNAAVSGGAGSVTISAVRWPEAFC